MQAVRRACIHAEPVMQQQAVHHRQQQPQQCMRAARHPAGVHDQQQPSRAQHQPSLSPVLRLGRSSSGTPLPTAVRVMLLAPATSSSLGPRPGPGGRGGMPSPERGLLVELFLGVSVGEGPSSESRLCSFPLRPALRGDMSEEAMKPSLTLEPPRLWPGLDCCGAVWWGHRHGGVRVRAVWR
jgi:hypothetical protein